MIQTRFFFTYWLLVPVLVACNDNPHPSGKAAPARVNPAAPDASVVTSTSRGEGKTAAAGESSFHSPDDITITSSGLERVAMIHVPPSYDGVRSLPVVLVLHPLLLTYKEMREIANVEPFSDDPEHAFIALFPNGIDRSWNAGACCGHAKEEGIDDVGFIRDLLSYVASRWRVDPLRIYAMGFSNGAFLSHRLACELPGGLRAIVPVAGTLGISESTCKPEHAAAVLAIHGTDDELVPFAGGSPKIWGGDEIFESPGATDAFWATENGCRPTGGPYFTHGEVSCVRHDGCRDEATVALCTVTGGGHQWPPTGLPTMGHATKDIDATRAAIEFFRAHGLTDLQ
jgi:polyhydroxybutyrate depolymerase